MEGTIKRLKEGFGFIRGTDGVERFFHRSVLENESFPNLVEGQAVTFEPDRGEKGPRAVNVRVV